MRLQIALCIFESIGILLLLHNSVPFEITLYLLHHLPQHNIYRFLMSRDNSTFGLGSLLIHEQLAFVLSQESHL